jgi:AmmeMemoRadiSam system protein B
MIRRKRVFLLGPSHHYYLDTCALSRCKTYETPLGDLKLDLDTIAELEKTRKFSHMSRSADEDEHSLEMHLPYIYKMLSLYVFCISCAMCIHSH